MIVSRSCRVIILFDFLIYLLGILISGFSPEFNLVVKSGVIILILMLQSPLVSQMLGQWRAPVAETPTLLERKLP